MKTAAAIRRSIRRVPRGKPFTNSRFLHLGATGTVNKALARLVAEKVIVRPARGVYARPEQSRHVVGGNVPPEAMDVVDAIVKRSGETIKPHGAAAANALGLSTQMPLIYVFYTSGPSRYVKICNMDVKFIHTDSRRLLQLAGSKAGLAIAALWYMGRRHVNPGMISKIRKEIGPEQFGKLSSADLPAWMSRAISASSAHA